MVYNPGTEGWSGARDPLANDRDRTFQKREQIQGRTGLSPNRDTTLARPARIMNAAAHRPDIKRMRP